MISRGMNDRAKGKRIESLKMHNAVEDDKFYYAIY